MFVVKYKKKDIFPTLFEGNSNGNGNNPLLDPANSIWRKSDGTVVDIKNVVTVVEAVMQDLNQNYPSVERVIKHKDIIYTDNPYIQTMATDGVSIFINPAFVEYLINKDPEGYGPLYVEFVLVHEALHILFDHCAKHMQNIDKYSDSDKVNQAQDYEINYIIENFLREGIGQRCFTGKTSEIGGLINDEFGKKGLTWEEIYDKIPAIKREKNIRKTSNKWKDGFAAGYNEIIDKLRKQSLVEKCVLM